MSDSLSVLISVHRYQSCFAVRLSGKVKKLLAKRMGSAWSGTLSEPKRQHVAFCNLARQRYQSQRNPLRRFLGGREAALHLVISRSHGKQLLQMENGATANTEPAGFFAEMIRGDRRSAVTVRAGWETPTCQE